MAQVMTQIPDDLEARVRSHLSARGEDLATFTARAFDEQLSLDDDPRLQSELTRKSRQALEEFDAGQGIDGLKAMRDIAAERGLKFNR